MTEDTRPSEDRLREALEQIADSEPASGSWDGWREVRRLRDIATAALASSRPAPDTRTEAQPYPCIYCGTALNECYGPEERCCELDDHPYPTIAQTLTNLHDDLDRARALSETPSEAPPTEPSLDRGRLYDAHIAVESGYIHQPDRLTRAYWNKVADAYDRRTEFAREAAEESAHSGRSR